MNEVVIDSIVVGPFAANCYFVKKSDSQKCVIIDPGGDAELLLDKLLDLNLELQALLITHGHIDHVMALSEISKKIPVPVYAHKDDKQLLENIKIQGQMFGLSEFEQPTISNWIQESDLIEIAGLKIKVLHTPGHSPGGCCYLLNSKIFVGDTLFESSIGRTDLPGGDYDLLISTIKTKLFSLPDEMIVYPGHGETTTIGHEKKYNPFLRGEI